MDIKHSRKGRISQPLWFCDCYPELLYILALLLICRLKDYKFGCTYSLLVDVMGKI